MTTTDLATYGRAKAGKVSSSDDWESPWDLVEAVAERYGPVILDVAGTMWNAKAPRWIEAGSLEADWVGDLSVAGVNWANPPYSRPNKPMFSEKAIATAKAGRGTVLCLPADMGNGWFHELFLRPFQALTQEHAAEGPLRGWMLAGTNDRGFRQSIHWLSYRVQFGSPLNPDANGSTGGTVVIACLPPGAK